MRRPACRLERLDLVVERRPVGAKYMLARDDDVDLIGTVGDSRITKAGLTAVRVRIEGILGPFLASGVIDSFSVVIPLLAILALPDSARDAADTDRSMNASRNSTSLRWMCRIR